MQEISRIDAMDATVQAYRSMPMHREVAPEAVPLDFHKVFKNSLSEVNGLDTQANRMVEALATGKTNDVSGVMMAVQKANMSFSMLLQIRNKIVEAYEELLRMRM